MTAMTAHLDAEIEALIAAMGVLNSAAPHSVGTIRTACVMAQRYGDGAQIARAREVLAELDARQAIERKAYMEGLVNHHRTLPRPPYSPPVTRIRDVLAGACVALAVAYVALLGVMVW